MRKSLFKELKKRILVMDGAMGTILMQNGVAPSDNFDLQNLRNPNLVLSIHKAYVSAGADIIETNTFGANRIKLAEYKMEGLVKKINQKAVRLARQAAGEKALVCGSIGPLGKLMEPFGEVSFDEACEVFAEQVEALKDADCLSIETISDIQEMRAALIAAKEKTKIPIICSLTYDQNGLTIYGTPPEAAAATLEALGADILSANCSTGPKDMLKIAKRLLASTSLPIMVMPNAGMPEIVGDKTIYKMTPQAFGKYALQFAKLGVNIIGGCCGTTPEHIHEVKCQMSNVKIKEPRIHSQVPYKIKFSSRSKVIEVKNLLKIGERINPTGRKALREEIKNGQFHLVREEAADQTKAGADLLDINISVPQGDDLLNMKKAIEVVSSASPLPLCVDSPNIAALEAGLKHFPGRALLNSVNGKRESLKQVLPLAKKYGAAVIGLCYDEKGIPKTFREKFLIAKKIVKAAKLAGVKDVFIDTLVMSAAVSLDDAIETLKAIPKIKKSFNVKTLLGISNVSHGLPNRPRINALYLKLAQTFGLDAAILDPLDPGIIKALTGKPFAKEKLIDLLKKEIKKTFTNPVVSGKAAIKQLEPNLKNIEASVTQGASDIVEQLVKKALLSMPPQKIIDQALLPAMEKIGDQFSRKAIFLPQVLLAASAMQTGFELCKAKIPQENIKKHGIILLATVFGDVHDMGKNIVKMMLQNQGFEVVDLGKDVSSEYIIETAKKIKPAAIALSALLTTTMLEMKKVKEALINAGLNIPIIAGGAVVTSDFAAQIGALYGADAAQAVKLAKSIILRSSTKL